MIGNFKFDTPRVAGAGRDRESISVPGGGKLFYLDLATFTWIHLDLAGLEPSGDW